jgi:hypothetical protein
MLAAAAMMAHSGGNGMARVDRVTGWLGAGARGQGRKAPNLAGERVNGEAMGWAVASGDRVDSLITGMGEAADKRGRVDRGRADAGRGHERLTCEVGLSEAGAREVGRAGPRASARKREGGDLGRTRLNRGGGIPFFLFLFLFPNLFFFLLFYNLLFPLNKYLSKFLGCQNILCEVLLTTMVCAYDE